MSREKNIIKISKEKSIIIAARTISMMFTPFYLPLVGLIVLFTFSYLSLLPAGYRFMVLSLVYLFTILMPTFLIRLYRNYHGWTLFELSSKRRRLVPYLISICSYLLCIQVLNALNIFHFVSSIVFAALMVQIVCAIINVWWKISTHTAAIGGVAGALLVFAEIFSFNPVCWLCLTLIVAGLLGSARMFLRQHTLAQVCVGFLVGFLIGGTGIFYFAID